MQSLSNSLFLILNAPEHPPTAALMVATILAQYTILLIPLLLVIGWLRGERDVRVSLLQAATAGVLALLIAQLICLVWPTPRPFMIGVGHQFLAHASDPSFPSDHLTLWWSVAFSLMLQAHTRATGILLAIAGLPVAWARIYLGVHFPLDMAGAMALGAISATVAQRGRHWLAGAPYALATGLYHSVFGAAIRRGWLPR
jgi:undecaprenyl-diphosphatase